MINTMNNARAKKSDRGVIWFLLGFWLLSASAAGQVTAPLAQEKPPAPIKINANGLDAASRKEIQFAEPLKVKLVAKDNFELFATYYAGIHGKKTPVVILLHDLLGTSADVSELAVFLQTSYGFSVITPDLRGHGESKKTGSVEIDPEKISRTEFESLVLDIEACKKYLIGRNDEGELNVDMLTVIAVGKSCIPTVNWSLSDWSFPVLAGLRQGQDVKAIVLISPEQSFKGVKLTNSLRAGLFTGKDVAAPLLVILAVGRDNPELLKETEAISAIVKRNRKVTDKVIDGVTEKIVDGLFVFEYPHNGAVLTKAESGDLQSLIGQMVFLEIFQKSDLFPWQVRGKK